MMKEDNACVSERMNEKQKPRCSVELPGNSQLTQIRSERVSQAKQHVFLKRSFLQVGVAMVSVAK